MKYSRHAREAQLTKSVLQRFRIWVSNKIFKTANGRELARMIASYARSFVSIRGWIFARPLLQIKIACLINRFESVGI
jgi:hypothetical protein